MGQWGWATALFEGVGEVVFVEDGVAGGEEGGEEFLGVVEGVDEVGFVGWEACGCYAFGDGVAVVASYDYGDVDVFADVTAEVAVEVVLLVAEFDHSGSDDDAFAGFVEVGEDVDGHARSGGVGVEGVVDDGDAAGGSADAEAVFHLSDGCHGVAYHIGFDAEGEGYAYCGEDVGDVAFAEKFRFEGRVNPSGPSTVKRVPCGV